MRVFIALDIEEAIRERIARYLDGVREFAPEARWVRPESIHVTLKFIGEKPVDVVEEIKRDCRPFRRPPSKLRFAAAVSFPVPKPPGYSGSASRPVRSSSLARAVDEATAALGIPKEEHRFTPHLTLARGAAARAPPDRLQKDDAPSFQRLQEKLAAWPLPSLVP